MPDSSERASMSELTRAELVARLDEAHDQQRAISAVLRAVVASGGLQPVLDEIVVAARTLCEAEHAQLYLLDGDVFRIRAGSEDKETAYAYAEAHPHPFDRTTVVGRAGLARDVVQIPDVLDDPGVHLRRPDHRRVPRAPRRADHARRGADRRGRGRPRRARAVHRRADRAGEDVRRPGRDRHRQHALDRGRRAPAGGAVSVPLAAGRGARHVGAGPAAPGRPPGVHLVPVLDLRGFTAFAETAAPEELFEVLRAYHELLGELIAAHHGTLEHFAGDGAMVFFNDPVEVPEHELEAVRLALAARERFAELASTRQRRGIELALGVGIEAGYATLGRIGFEGRYNYGALGPVTYLASRLSTHAEPGQILIGQRLHAAVEEAVEAAPVGELELKGFGRPVAAYEVRGLRA